ncbi:MAG: response regulator [Lachnospiraceae bacterium]|nr:response regulator [Lachnospiraceae bacterium]
MGWIWPTINWICLIICFVFAVYIMKREASNVQKYLMLCFVCGFAASVCNMVEMYADTLEVALTAAKIAYMGKLFMVLFALVFAVEFAQIRFSELPCYLLGLIDTAFLALVMTNEHHHWFYRDVHMEEKSNGMLYMVTDKGPLYYVIMVEIALCIIAAVIVVLRGTRGQSTESKGRVVALIALSTLVIVLIASALCYILETIDPATVVITAMEILIMIGVHTYGLFDSKQIVQKSALEATQEGLIFADEKKRLIYANAFARELFGESIAKGESLAYFLEEKEWVFDKDGCHYEARVSEVRNKQGDAIQGYIMWIFDMTFINQYTSEMIRHKEEAENADRAKTNFLAHISHELRTPMNAIVGYSELAGKEQTTSKGMTYLNNIKNAAKMLIGMMNEILDITKIESGKIEITEISYNLDKLVCEVSSMMEAQTAKKGLEFGLEVDSLIPKNLIGDRGKIYEVIMNLLSNAIKYTREGSVSLRLKRLESIQGQVLLQIEVEDTGIGIKEEFFDKVFDKFAQFDREKNYDIQGSGLGLAITQYYVQLMEGEIHIESEYGKGTRFVVTLWQGIADGAVEEETETLFDESIILKKAKVLVVDDNEMNCDVARGLLNCMGVEADIALSGEECLAMLKDGKEYAVILTDHMMPQMDGVELMHHIRTLGEEYKQLPIILQTANAISGVREHMLHEGFDDFIAKPIQIGELQKVLLKYLGTEEI